MSGRSSVASVLQLAAGAAFLAASLCTAGSTSYAQTSAATLPQYADETHLGVASCAGSTCHGAVTPFENSNVLQNEYVTWVQQDEHANAYAVLMNDESKRIARNLGIGDAHTADLCLDCHADNPPEEKRGPRFQISDGVGCESCHGGAQKWLGEHVAGANHPQNVANGMYPSDDPVARATLCLSCHFGNDRKFVTHRIMGAGHPRMSFELDTFTAIQPAHFVIDGDYAEREKVVAGGVKVWAVGQVIAVRSYLEALADPERNRDGIFPEFVLFDCHACHTPMSRKNWQPQRYGNSVPGVPHVNDANMIMLRALVRRIDPDLGAEVARKTKALHTASLRGTGSLASAARDLKELTDQLVLAISAYDFEAADMGAILATIIDQGRGGQYLDYAAAEQATMAIGSIVTALNQAGAIDAGDFAAINDALDAAFKAVENDESYSPYRYRQALERVAAAVPNRLL